MTATAVTEIDLQMWKLAAILLVAVTDSLHVDVIQIVGWAGY
jgi:hypothetical protein